MKSTSGIVDKVVTGGLIAIVVTAPTQYSFDVLGGMHLSVVDPLVWLVALLWGISRWRSGKLGTVRPPPLVAILFVALAALSLIHSAHLLKSAKDVIQYAEYFIAAYLLFADSIDTARKLRIVVYLFLGLATAIVLTGLAQYLMPAIPDLEVRGTFGNRNVFGGFLALALPLIYALFLFESNRGRRAWLLLTLIAGLAAALAGGALVAVLLAGAVISVFRKETVFVAYGLLVALALVFGWNRLPRDNPGIVQESIAFYHDDGTPAMRYTEWQAALAMTCDHPLLGVGIGNYQENIGQNYGTLPSVPVKAEADSQNLYLVLASSLGLPALLCFVGLLIVAARQALNCFFHTNESFHKGLALGLFGSVLAFAITALWAPLIVRGIGVPLALVLGVTAALEQLRKR